MNDPPTTYQTADIKYCHIPPALPPKEADLYEKIRTLHCDRKSASHDCSGRVTLDRNGMTLQCPKCGDFRSVYRRTGE